jgi:preprotein translocase subunit SecG
MQNVVLIIHLLLAITLIGLVLLQRSEGGGLGMGGGGAGGGAMSSRAASSAMTKLTWILAIAFICTSLGLTILQVQKSSGSSVLDQLMPVTEKSSTPSADDLLPPSAAESGPLLPIAE